MNMSLRVLVTDGMDASAVAKLRADGFEVVEQFYEPDVLGEALRDFDCVIIRSATKIKEPQIDAAKGSQLKHAPRLFQRRGGAGHRPAVRLRPEPLHRRPHHAGGQVGEKRLLQGL